MIQWLYTIYDFWGPQHIKGKEPLFSIIDEYDPRFHNILQKFWSALQI